MTPARQQAEAIISENVWPTSDGPFVRVNGNPRDLERLLDAIAAALEQGRADARRRTVEESAQVAEEHEYRHKTSERSPAEPCGEIIAAAIRALAEAPTP